MGIKLAIATGLIATVVVGCGDGSSEAPGSAAASTPTGQSAEFVGGGPNGKLATLGKEAEAAEREAASRVLEESFQARAARDWAGQCSTLVAPLASQIEQASSVLASGVGCAKALEAQAEKATPSTLVDTMTGPIDVLRVNGNRAFAFYHGTQGEDYVIPMAKEGGEWKVASLLAKKAP
jgi:hypothetical protein